MVLNAEHGRTIGMPRVPEQARRLGAVALGLRSDELRAQRLDVLGDVEVAR